MMCCQGKNAVECAIEQKALIRYVINWKVKDRYPQKG